MPNSDSVEGTADQNIDGLLSGVRWNTLHLTYSFPASASFYGPDYGRSETQTNFQPLNPAQRAAVYRIFEMVSAVTELTFTEIEETSTSHATLRLAGSDAPSSAWTYLPGETSMAGDSWFRTSGDRFDYLAPGGYGFYVFIHEIAHALGLKHGHEDDGFGPMTPGHDSMEFSVATYRSYVGASGQYVENEFWGYAQTLMMYDIAALQHMYGANFAANSGNTTYRWDRSTGEAFINGAGQGAPGANRIFMTIWDGGGIDTYNFSNYRTDLKVDLRPGAWSMTSGGQVAILGANQEARGNIANALTYQGDLRSLIENATGGSGDDRIVGNSAANVIKGNGGGDRLFGLEGDDTLTGGRGRDYLKGGSGDDVMVFDAKPNKKWNMDRIADFTVRDDTIHLENAVFKKVGKAGKLAGKAFWKGAEAHDASDRIIYDSKSGFLYYDPDGTGSAPHIQFAKLPKKLKVSAADFLMI